MKEYFFIVAAIISGSSAIISALIAWKLKYFSDEKAWVIALGKEKRDEIKQLYTATFVLFEQIIRQVLNKEEVTLGRAVSENNAQIHLLAPNTIITQHSEVADCLENWSRLYAKATPRQMKVGDQTVTILQAPDPTKEFKEPMNLAYQKLQDALNKLVELMRAELDNA